MVTILVVASVWLCLTLLAVCACVMAGRADMQAARERSRFPRSLIREPRSLMLDPRAEKPLDSRSPAPDSRSPAPDSRIGTPLNRGSAAPSVVAVMRRLTPLTLSQARLPKNDEGPIRGGDGAALPASLGSSRLA